jgi:hypothetical protein
MRTRPLLQLVACAAVSSLLCACPGEVDKGYPDPGASAKAQVGEEDERVVKVGGDLYSKEASSNPAADGELEPGANPGSGKPDETNGVCRLYAPKLAAPECCKFETGFDVEAAKRICGHSIYLGESIRMSCGYFFTNDELEGHPSFRASLTAFDSPHEAAKTEAEQLNFQLRKRDIKPEPIEGVKGAYMLRNKNFRWAFLPGWKGVRKVSWIEESCADDKVNELLAIVAAAVPPPTGAERPLIPAAR